MTPEQLCSPPMISLYLMLGFIVGVIVGAAISFYEGMKALKKLHNIHMDDLRQIREMYIEHTAKMEKKRAQD